MIQTKHTDTKKSETLIMGGTSMARKVTSRFLVSRHREQRPDSLDDVEEHHETSVNNVGDVEFEFLDDGNMFLAHSASSDDCDHHHHHHTNEMELDEEDDQDKEDHDDDKNRSFWDSQLQILQASVCRTSSLESRIRHATKAALEEIQSEETVCGCGRVMGVVVTTTSCRNCLMREVSRRLQKAGFDSAICKTKWRRSPDIPSGEHSFLDVIDTTSSKKGEVRVIIELNFRAEFEMARGSEEYKRLVRRLPEVFVGKTERISNLIKILCMGAKRCMKEKKMHMGPWRKQRYMQAKWLGACERNTSTTPIISSMGYSERVISKPKPKAKASMLTVDLLDKIPNMHCTAVEVL